MGIGLPRSQRVTTVARVAIIGTVGFGLLTACGAIKTSNSGTSDTSANTTVTRAGVSAASTNPEVAAAQAVIAKYETAPTTINQTVPLTGKVPQGRTYVVIGCELSQCKTISDGATAAAKALGWKVQYLQYSTTDGSTFTSAMKQALQYNPIAVSPIGYSQAVWAALQPQYAKAGIPIAPIAVGDLKVGPAVLGGSSTQTDYAKSGEILANWFIADSQAAGKALVMDVPAFAVLKAYGDSVKATVAKGCSGCNITALDETPAELGSGSVVPAIVSALQRDKSIKYLIATDGAFLTGLPQALKAAGITGVKIAGGAPDITNLQALKTGTEAAWTGEPTNQFGWVGVDIAARAVLHMSVPDADGGRPQELLLPSNIGTPTNFLAAPVDFADQFKKLWGVS